MTSSGLTTVASRTILGSPGTPGGRADQIAQRLGDAIRRGVLADGGRLPPEPELARQVGVATVTLREALSLLRAQGLVVTRRGRGGGTFVRRAVAPTEQVGILELREIGDVRRAVAGAAAALAAERAVDDEVEGLRRLLARGRASSRADERGRLDAQLAIAVAAAAQSARLTRYEVALRAELGELLWRGLTDADHHATITRRRAQLAAIAGRHAERARRLAEEQVIAETTRLVALRLNDTAGTAGTDPGATT